MEEVNIEQLQTINDSIEEQGEQIQQILNVIEEQKMTEEMTETESESDEELITVLQDLKYTMDAQNELSGAGIIFDGVLCGVILVAVLFGRINK